MITVWLRSSAFPRMVNVSLFLAVIAVDLVSVLEPKKIKTYDYYMKVSNNNDMDLLLTAYTFCSFYFYQIQVIWKAVIHFQIIFFQATAILYIIYVSWFELERFCKSYALEYQEEKKIYY